MIEYLLIFWFATVSFAVLGSRKLQSNKWFFYPVNGLAIIAVIYLVIDSGWEFGFVRLILLSLAVASLVITAINKRFNTHRKADR